MHHNEYYPNEIKQGIPYTPNSEIKPIEISEQFIVELLSLVSQSNIKSWIHSLSSFPTRHTKSVYIDQVADWLLNELQSFGYRNVYFHNYFENKQRLRNVICEKTGRTDSTIIVCAHYDSIMEDKNNAEETAPGANDNASGVASVLDLARILSRIGLNDSVQFVFFSGEEQGLWGSTKYAQHIKETNVNLSNLINLDMVGHPPSYEKKVIIERDMGNKVSINDRDSQRLAQVLEEMANRYTDLKVLPGPIYDSDYMPFEALGYTVVGIYDGGEVNPSYHNKTDTASTLDVDYIMSVTKIVLATIVNEAKAYNIYTDIL